MKLFDNKTFKVYLGYALLLVIALIFVVIFEKNAKMSEFLTAIENRTFDFRQSVIVNSKYRKASDDIVLLKIDDASYEYLLEKYGEWPIPRNVYADVINYLEKQNPKAIAFDLMFIKSIKSKVNADESLTKAITGYDNVFTSMNFDDQSYDVRKPITLPKALSVDVINNSKVDFSKNLTFPNCRPILSKIMNGTPNVGMINVSRSDDGVLRKIPPFMVYQDKFYPHLSFLVALKALDEKALDARTFRINKKSDMKIGNRTVPIDRDGGVILNWYGADGKAFKEVSFYKVVKAIEGEKNGLENVFKNKIIYIGTTALSLYDTKSVPIDKVYPGVELHTTFINNFIDNDFIKKADIWLDVLISIVLSLIVGLVVLRSTSTFVSLTTAIVTVFGYIILTYYVMKFFNIWLAIVVPIMSVLSVFVAAYIVKYILKSRDFEYQYRLATTDGLTELYNHRYFQEQMILQVENCKRYNSNFSLILIDIDFFKKFNDVHGHQSGDAVLRQVAQKLKKNVRASDFVCRYGGEEMTIILPNTDKDEAIITAQKICQLIAEKPFKLANNQESKVTISLGVATYPQDGASPVEVIEQADKCLYNAKENGRNQVGF